MLFETLYLILIVVEAILTAYYLYRAKNGPTEKQCVKMETKYGRDLTEDDIKSYKSEQKKFALGIGVF